MICVQYSRNSLAQRQQLSIREERGVVSIGGNIHTTLNIIAKMCYIIEWSHKNELFLVCHSHLRFLSCTCILESPNFCGLKGLICSLITKCYQWFHLGEWPTSWNASHLNVRVLNTKPHVNQDRSGNVSQKEAGNQCWNMTYNMSDDQRREL